jgi:Glycosyl transferase family 2
VIRPTELSWRGWPSGGRRSGSWRKGIGRTADGAIGAGQRSSVCLKRYARQPRSAIDAWLILGRCRARIGIGTVGHGDLLGAAVEGSAEEVRSVNGPSSMNCGNWPQNVILSRSPVMNVCEELAAEVSGPRRRGSYIPDDRLPARSDSSSKSEGLAMEGARCGQSWLHGRGSRSLPVQRQARGRRKMNAAPQLSIGLSVCNGGSLDAVLDQSYEDFELIISGKASTDGSSGICRRYKKDASRIRYFRQPRNIGLAPNHNFVISQASSYHHADRIIVPEIALHGPFHQAPDWLYFRRDHRDRATRAYSTVRTRCANMDPRRANRLRHPTARLLAEYIWGYAAVIRRAPLSPADRRECSRYLAQWMAGRAVSRAFPKRLERTEDQPSSAVDNHAVSVDAVVAGQRKRLS